MQEIFPVTDTSLDACAKHNSVTSAGTDGGAAGVRISTRPACWHEASRSQTERDARMWRMSSKKSERIMTARATIIGSTSTRRVNVMSAEISWKTSSFAVGGAGPWPVGGVWTMSSERAARDLWGITSFSRKDSADSKIGEEACWLMDARDIVREWWPVFLQ